MEPPSSTYQLAWDRLPPQHPHQQHHCTSQQHQPLLLQLRVRVRLRCGCVAVASTAGLGSASDRTAALLHQDGNNGCRAWRA